MTFLNFLSQSTQQLRFSDPIKAGISLTVLAGMILFSSSGLSSSYAYEPNIQIVDSWVEDGFEFYVAFESTPSNATCAITGEGLIEFEVSYVLSRGSEPDSAFGVAIWYPSPDEESMVFTEHKAIGSQAHCSRTSPCRIRNIRVVKAWCPYSEEPIWGDWGVTAIP